MTLGFVIFGIATGVLLAGCVLALGGGVWLSALAYIGGGLTGVLFGLQSGPVNLPGRRLVA